MDAAILNTRETKKVRLGSPVPANFSRQFMGAAILDTRESKKVRLGSPVPANFSRQFMGAAILDPLDQSGRGAQGAGLLLE
ncbi:hypothetical protein J6590_105989, partial [Homalodisca vitripennis]